MTSTIDSSSVRSGHTARRDPAAIWAPLAGLADAATEAVTDSGTVAVTRGFDRKSRQRAKALNELLEERGVNAVEVTPAPDSERLLDGSTVAAVVNLVGSGAWNPYRLAAKKQVPVLTPRPTEEDSATEATRDVISVTGTDSTRDIALTRVAVLPEDTENSDVTLTRDGEPLTIPGGQIEITPNQRNLDVRVQGPDFAAQDITVGELRVQTSGAPHRFIRDELPIAEFEGSLTVTSEPAGLRVRPV